MADSDVHEDKTELAEERTHFAEDRTIQATERTFAGWMRTAFAAIALGIAFQAFFGKLEPPWLAKAIATLFILLSIPIAFTAERRACRTFKRLSTHGVNRPKRLSLRWISWSVIAGALLLIAGLWLLNNGNVGEGHLLSTHPRFNPMSEPLLLA